jgi:hypothetical protein
MKKQLNEEISRIKGMMGSIQENSFVGRPFGVFAPMRCSLNIPQWVNSV